jgi:DNA-binding Lrp family transcriptional regulator
VAPEELKRLLESVPDVIDAATVSGSADAVLHMRSHNMGALEDALEVVRKAPNVDHTRTSIVMSKLVIRN